MNLAFFIFLSLVLFLQVADYIETVKGLDKGGDEKNPLNRWLFAKIGMPLTTFLEAVVTLILSAVFFTMDPAYGVTFTATLSAVMVVAVVRNFLLLRKK